jgi:hypothetical protein
MNENDVNDEPCTCPECAAYRFRMAPSRWPTTSSVKTETRSNGWCQMMFASPAENGYSSRSCPPKFMLGMTGLKAQRT